MKERGIILVSALATIAIVILLSLQTYWLKTFIGVNDRIFISNANMAVGNAIYKIEKSEIAKSVKKRVKKFPKDSVFFKTTDSAKKFLSMYYQYFQDTLDQQSMFANHNNQSKIASDLLNNMLNFMHFDLIDNRLNSIKLDSALRIELRNKGIETNYEYGVYSEKRHFLMIQKTGLYTKELMTKSLKFNLFPGDIFKESGFLYVYFPHEKGYILKNMWKMFLISGLLVGILVFIFIHTILILIKQKRLSEMTSNMINNLTHEFKTPISTISLACEVLNDTAMMKTGKMFKNYIDVIKEENKRLEIMTEVLFEAAVIEKGQLKLRKEKVSIHNLIYDVIKNKNIEIEKKNGNIKTELTAVHDLINCDKEHLKNVIYNLLDNAIKYSPESPEIVIKSENIEEGIIISVTDKGMGISRKDQKKIFENLYRVPTGNLHDIKGFGLGLGYVKAVIEKHGGSVGVVSELKKGTTFNILLPFD